MKKFNLILGFILITTGIVHGVDIMPEESFEGSFPQAVGLLTL
ncbi:MAG: hypothetical protein U5N56_08175 [Candidatus Marinimicrobia bacterium]|nr:hypothetical protein [Candidatus Neomarinimicrobiota bacterium]